MTKPLVFSKGSDLANSPDTLMTQDTVEVLLGLSEGPIQGLVDGPKSFYLDDTALVNANGKGNFDSFVVEFWPGDETGHTVQLQLGGAASPINVSQTLSQNAPITRQGQQTGIQAADFRIVIQQLYSSDDKGKVSTEQLQLKFEYKKLSDPDWKAAWVSTPSVPLPETTPGNGQHQSWSVDNTGNVTNYSFDGDRPATTTSGAPTTTASAASELRYDPATGKLYAASGNSWVEVPTTTGDGYVSFDDDGTQRKLWTFDTPPAAASTGDLAYRAESILAFNGISWTTPGSALYGNGATSSTNAAGDGIWTIKDKITQATPYNLRVYLDTANEQYEYRVTKISADSTTDTFGDYSVVALEAIDEIKLGPLSFTALSTIRVMGQSSDQFTGLPNWSADADGRIFKVPSNYDPVARTYTGIWDGTYKLAYTNNLAWVFQDFVEHTRYGLSSVYPQTCDPWSIYEWAQYCDVMIERPDGSLRPRWTYNDFVQEPRDAREMAQYICGAGQARYIDDGNGIVSVIVDKDEPAVALFTPENVTPEGFSYSYTDPQARPTKEIVSFVNPDLNWKVDKRVVPMDTDDDDVAVLARSIGGDIQDKFVATGCTDGDEAVCRARARLVTGLTEKEMVTFSTNRKGRYLAEWSVILVADPDMGRGLTGRVKSVLDTHTVQLRDPVVLEANISYSAVFEIVNPAYPATSSDPFTTVTLGISTGAGTVTQLAFDASLPDLPERAVFAIQSNDTTGIPKAYRIININDPDSTSEVVQITALELNRAKYAYIDSGVGGVSSGTNTGLNARPDPPTNLKVTPDSENIGGQTVRILTLTFDPSPSQFVKDYKIFSSLDGVPLHSYEQPQTSLEIQGADTGSYTFTVLAVGVNGKESAPATITFDLTGEVRFVPPPKSLRLVGGTSINTFDTLDATFAWDVPDANPAFDHYRVVVKNSGGAILREEDVDLALSWTYKFEENKADGSGSATRTFTVEVYAIDILGNSSAPATLTATNPPPAWPGLLSVVNNPYGATVTVVPSSDKDVMGLLAWVEPGAGFDPTTLSASYDAKQSQFQLTGSVGDHLFVRAAYYDAFSKDPDQLNISEEYALTIPAVYADYIGDMLATELLSQVDLALDQVNAAIEAADNEANDVATAAEAAMVAAIAAAQQQVSKEKLLYIDNAPVGVIVENHTTELDDHAETLDLLGVKSADGSTFALNLTTVTDDNGTAMTTRLSSLQAQISTNASSLTTEQSVRASGDSANATSITNLTSTVSSNFTTLNSSINTEKSTRASGDSANATSITNLTSTVNSNYTTLNASITSEQNTRSTAVDSLSSSINSLSATVTSNYNTLNSSISSVDTARASGDSALTSSINSLTSTVNGNTASISSTAATLSTLSGQVYSTYTLVANSNGNIASMKLVTSSGSTTVNAVIFETNNFLIRSAGNSSLSPFLFTNGTLYLNQVMVASANIGTAQVQTLHIADGNVVSFVSSSTSHGGASISTSFSTFETVSKTTNGTGFLRISYRFDEIAHDDIHLDVGIVQDGTMINATAHKVWDYTAVQVNQGDFLVQAAPSAGSHTWQLQVRKPSGNAEIYNTTLVVEEFKK